MSRVPQGSVLSPLLFLEYVNNIWSNPESTIRLFTDNCIIFREIINNKCMKELQIYLNSLGEWVLENEMIINRTESKAVCFRIARVTEPLNYSLRDIGIPDPSYCKYSGIILSSYFS
jgi:hypothetical protein